MTEIVATDIDTAKALTHLSVSTTHSALQNPAITAVDCSRQNDGICTLFLSSSDHSIALLQRNKVIWSREEALAKIIAVEIVDLPMSDRDHAIETEFDQKESE